MFSLLNLPPFAPTVSGEMQIFWFIILALIFIWSIIWKGMALWRAAQKNSYAWFIILLVVNTLGILEILYLYVFSRMKAGDKQLSK
jgi:methionyl-tRNA synthetase